MPRLTAECGTRRRFEPVSSLLMNCRCSNQRPFGNWGKKGMPHGSVSNRCFPHLYQTPSRPDRAYAPTTVETIRTAGVYIVDGSGCENVI